MKKLSNIFFIYVVITFFAFASFSIFWDLGRSSLQPWDEAWYGSVAREIIRDHDLVNLKYNQTPFYDHPQMSFYFKAASMKIFGNTSFAVRFPEAIMALLSLAMLIAIGKKFDSKWAGLWAALILFSSRWFLFRARTGNIDMSLVFTQLLVFWSVLNLRSYSLFERIPIKDREKSRNKDSFSARFAWSKSIHLPVVITYFSLALSLSTKSLISLQLSPLVALASLEYVITNKLFKKVTDFLQLIVAAVIPFLLPLTPQLALFFSSQGGAFIARQKTIGLRSGTDKGFSPEYIKLTLSYLQAAMHKWFKVGILGLGIIFISSGIKWSRETKSLFEQSRESISILHASLLGLGRIGNFIYLLLYIFLVGFPYFISEKTEIWHLIPLVATLAIAAGVGLSLLINYISSAVSMKIETESRNHQNKLRMKFYFAPFLHAFLSSLSLPAGQAGRKVITPAFQTISDVLIRISLTWLITLVLILITLFNWHDYTKEFMFIEVYPEDYQKITQHFLHPDQKVYVTSDAFFPGLVFYSDLKNGAIVEYMSDDGLLPACQHHWQMQTDIQAVAWLGDWLNHAVGDSKVVAREGGLVYINLTNDDCLKLFPEISFVKADQT